MTYAAVIHRPAALVFAAAVLYLVALGSVSLRAAAQTPAPGVVANALPPERTGAEIFQAACATCHARNGRGSPQSVVGFDIPIRDFTDCTATAETSPDWFAVVHEGGPIRGLNRHMPAFGDALSEDDITKVVAHLRSFCANLPAWPLGDLNFPRAFFTEKAFPENETVWTMGLPSKEANEVTNQFVYERRFGARNQVEAVVPVDVKENLDAGVGAHGPWVAGIGDIAFAYRRTFLASQETGTIAAAGVEVALPTGNDYKSLGNGYAIYEPFAMWGQALPRNSFLQMHGGMEFPSNWRGTKEAYLRTAIGTTFTGNRGFGRSWSPQMEVLWARPVGAQSIWDVVPQIQVSLSKMQHVLLAGGVRVPLSQTEVRHSQVVLYFLWDWFDGGLFQFWK